MITKLTIQNFNRFRRVDIELASPVVLVGPNNSGKTTALQADYSQLARLLKPNEISDEIKGTLDLIETASKKASR